MAPHFFYYKKCHEQESGGTKQSFFMEKYLSPSIDVISVEIELSFAASPGFNVPGGGNNGSGWDDGTGFSNPSNQD